MHPVVGLPVDLTAKESLKKLDGALRERGDVVIWRHKYCSAFNAVLDLSGKRTVRERFGKTLRSVMFIGGQRVTNGRYAFLSGGSLSFREEAVPRIFGQGHEWPDVHVRQW